MDEEALEDYISYETPIGQILLQITKLTKKPKHNDDLSKVSFPLWLYEKSLIGFVPDFGRISGPTAPSRRVSG